MIAFHAGVGKMSFDDQKLAENINTFVETVRAALGQGEEAGRGGG